MKKEIFCTRCKDRGCAECDPIIAAEELRGNAQPTEQDFRNFRRTPPEISANDIPGISL